jgi:TonB-linked SusC/RagA family outer membrane protein
MKLKLLYYLTKPVKYQTKGFFVICLLLNLFFVTGIFAQDIVVKGTVISGDDNSGLPGTNIIIKGTTSGTITDLDGNYTVEVPNSDAILIFSSVGFRTQEIPVGNRTTIDVVMEPEITSLSEIVVVGYGTQEKVSVTGSVVDVEGSELVKSPAVDITNSLAGRLAGVQVVQSSAEPGYDDAEIKIRGNNTLGNTSPLIVIDGIPDRDGGFGRLNPQDIESISVLKDASAAIYGARAANGAIIVTTNKGKVGKPTINFDFNYGWAQPTTIPEMSNAVEYANIINELAIYRNIPVNEWDAAWDAIQSTGTYTSPTPGVNPVSATYSPDAIQKHADGSDPWGYPDTDWFGDAFKKWSPQSRYDLQITGGAEKIRYFASIGYLDQDAYYKNSATFYRQYSARINLDADISEWAKVDLGLLGRREDRNFPTQSAGAIFRMLMRGRPVEPEVWPTGEPGPDIENGQNPYVVTTNATGYEKDPRDYFQSNARLTITQPWVEGLKLELSGAVDYNIRHTKTWETPWELYYMVGRNPDGTGILEPAVRSNFTDPRLTERYENVLNTNMTAILSYDHTFGISHTIGGLIGVTKEQFNGKNFEAFRRYFISTAVDQLFAGGSDLQNTDGGAYERARLGYYGRIQYDFRKKYLLEFIWRYDGSYIFPPGSRFGFFPGILGGWNISEENFFDVSWIDYLKVRASYGQMGNDQVFYDDELQEFAFLSTYDFGEYPINNTVVKTLYETVLANPDFTWEKANNLNIGLDATFLNNSLDLTLEYFYNKRTDILIQETGSTPASSGISDLLPPVNAGKVDNKGFEFNAMYNFNKSGVRWTAGINAGYAKNKVVFMDEIPGAPEYQWQEGKPIDAFLVYKSDGAFKDVEEIASNTIDYSGVTAELKPGDMKFEDVDGNRVIDADDQVRLDKGPEPTWNYGATFNLTWNNFDFSILFQGAAGHAIRIYTESGDIGNYLKYDHDNRWSIDNPSSEHPRLASRGDTYYTGGSFGDNTYFLFDKDYLRLKNLEIGYTVPMGNQNVVQRFRAYIRGFNLLTIAKQKIYDPEGTTGSGVFYPQSRILSGGFSITF